MQEAHERGNMLIVKLLALAVPTSDSQHTIPTHYKDIVCLPVEGCMLRRVGGSSKKASV